ncbi:DUF397 domain-containing protein [Actinoallomurus acaciae]|uniref:DUF397 domain-containing protein n=1 Tax=Actinoallomurus acaciae TaxID=502577 RepID=A0ABV5YBW4_9ACTN
MRVGSSHQGSGGVVEQQDLTWRKSSRSNANNSDCVEVARVDRDDDRNA